MRNSNIVLIFKTK